MSKDAEKEKSDLMRGVAREVTRKTEGAATGRVQRFVSQYFANVPPRDLIGRTPRGLFALAHQHLSFSSRRPPRKPVVRAYNPTKRKHGYESEHTVVEITNDDMPFLVDSVTAVFTRRNLTVYLVIHPIVHVRRAKNGRLADVFETSGRPGEQAESFIRLEITHQSGRPLEKIEAELTQVLTDVRSAVDDWRPMRDRMAALIEELETPPSGVTAAEARETREFLRWIHDNHYTFLGFREYTLAGRKTALSLKKMTGLGILRNSRLSVFEKWDHKDKQPPEVHAFVGYPDLLMATKSNRRSTIHRPVHMDTIGIKRLDAQGRVVGLRMFVGLFTSTAYNRSPRYIPLLRRRLQLVMEKARFAPSSHDGKALMNILETYPRDELFQISDKVLFETAMGILHLQERPETRLFIRHDELERFVSCITFMPRDRYSTDLRRTVEAILAEELQGRSAAFYTQLDDSPLARLHIIISMLSGAIPKYDQSRIEARITEAARSWADRLRVALDDAHGEEIAQELLLQFGEAFGPGYRERYSAADAVTDIGKVQDVIANGSLAMNLYRIDGSSVSRVRFKIYHPENPVPLSDVLPLFEHMGFKVIDESPHEVDAGDGRIVMIHDFGLDTSDGAAVDLDGIRDNFQTAFLRVWNGDVESDGFNALVSRGGLTWREVVVLRAYCKYLRQAGIAFSQTYMEQTLSNNPGLTRDIVNLFMARFDPATAKGKASASRVKRIRGRLKRGLETVVSADEDRILRRFLNLVESTLRTNYFQKSDDRRPKPYLSFKFDSQAIDDLPLPRPLREIFVYSPRVEGVHLRFGMVARGGLRWSDRREDFRTEVLGLVKAQQVKNAVIVPVGSKGGFVVKQPPSAGGRDAFMDEGIACYKTFISGLLDLTDNIRGPRIVPPKRVVRRDGDDPYLVVAADKGTATFSDIANSVSIEYGHWLGDAFASGGSQGYDHKKMGITARGAWESVKRHFREMGTDIQKQDFTVAGVGDMAGDVFGNGMLLSKHIKLIAAFNHMHIFVDPDPDPAPSFAERKRLFKMPRSSWADYDAEVMSKGAAIYERSAKSLRLSPEIRERFEIAKVDVTPNELIGHILRAQVDLMWFGGIGTYIKASAESHVDVGDRANDAIRVDGNELRCRVIGEGANLGATQRGRIEYALNGGRLNTDSIDNSAGVDSSDHEVNIKILIDSVVASGGLTEKQRNALLASMTDEVGKRVLVHNYRQTQAITLIESKGVHALDNQQRMMRALEKEDRLNRAVEFLPDDEMLSERSLAKQGLCRPELSVLISYAKIWLYDELIASDVPDDPFLVADLIDYFPTPLRSKYAKQIGQHRLRREIIATRATNSLVDRVGDTFVAEFMEKTGRSAAEIARAYTITRHVFRLRELWADIEAFDNRVPAAAQAAMLADINHLIEWATLWLLRQGTPGLDIGAHIREFEDGIAMLADNINSVMPAHYVSDMRKRGRAYLVQSVPERLAFRIAGLVNLYSGCDIVRLAAKRKLPVLDVARAYFAVGTRFKLGRLRAAAEHMDSESHWQQLAVAALIEEIYSHQLALTLQVLDSGGGKGDPAKAIEKWAAANDTVVGPTEQLLTELWATDVNDLSMVAVASRQIRTMTEGRSA